MSKRKNQSKNTGGRHRSGPPVRAQVRWEELAPLDSLCRQQFTMIGQIDELIADAKASEQIPNIAEVRERRQIIERDVGVYTQRLDSIAAKYRHRAGLCANPDEAMLILQIAEDYAGWQESFGSVVLPNVDFIINAYRNCPAGA